MTLNASRVVVPISPPQPNYVAQKLNQLHADLVSTARTWAVDEVGAAMAHQISDPLTALLLYLHEIKDAGEHFAGTESAPNSIQKLVEMALRETERVCDIFERFGHAVEAPASPEIAVARGREAIDLWTRSNNTKSVADAMSAPSRLSQNLLTPREREVLALITGGATNKEGGPRLGISKRTFEVHRAHIMEKLGAKNAADLVRMTLTESRQNLLPST